MRKLKLELEDVMLPRETRGIILEESAKSNGSSEFSLWAAASNAQAGDRTLKG